MEKFNINNGRNPSVGEIVGKVNEAMSTVESSEITLNSLSESMAKIVPDKLDDFYTNLYDIDSEIPYISTGTLNFHACDGKYFYFFSVHDYPDGTGTSDRKYKVFRKPVNATKWDVAYEDAENPGNGPDWVGVSQDNSTLLTIWMHGGPIDGGWDIYTSKDCGVTWNLHKTFNIEDLGFNKYQNNFCRGIFNMGDAWAVNMNGKLLVSTDGGDTWSTNNQFYGYLITIRKIDSYYYMIGLENSKYIRRSTDLSTWTQIKVVTSGYCRASDIIKLNGYLYLIGGSAFQIDFHYSSDGTNWESKAVDLGNYTCPRYAYSDNCVIYYLRSGEKIEKIYIADLLNPQAEMISASFNLSDYTHILFDRGIGNCFALNNKQEFTLNLGVNGLNTETNNKHLYRVSVFINAKCNTGSHADVGGEVWGETLFYTKNKYDKITASNSDAVTKLAEILMAEGFTVAEGISLPITGTMKLPRGTSEIQAIALYGYVNNGVGSISVLAPQSAATMNMASMPATSISTASLTVKCTQIF